MLGGCSCKQHSQSRSRRVRLGLFAWIDGTGVSGAQQYETSLVVTSNRSALNVEGHQVGLLRDGGHRPQIPDHCSVVLVTWRHG